MIPAKICGITRAEDALLAAELGAAAIGFVFYPRSPRYIDAIAAGRISEQLPQRMARVGVFVNPDPETMMRTAVMARLTHIQLHGDESRAFCEQSPLPVIKTVRDLIEFEKYEKFLAAAFLVDSKSAEQFGGTGQKSDWNFCRQVRERAPVVLAGGLAANNIASAIAAAMPDAVDLSSAVEYAPGVKDHQKLSEFFVALKSVPAARLSFRRNLF
ncbi:phosphoribosylanthranilate isomerase [candidate division KSB1 bacterium]|nr:phosphoribosylanthranilate isomerase [candidate division KSB1 bacterium]